MVHVACSFVSYFCWKRVAVRHLFLERSRCFCEGFSCVEVCAFRADFWRVLLTKIWSVICVKMFACSKTLSQNVVRYSMVCRCVGECWSVVHLYVWSVRVCVYDYETVVCTNGVLSV